MHLWTDPQRPRRLVEGVGQQKGKFSVAFGPETDRDEDGSSDEAEGTLAGKFNKSRTSVSGTWTMRITFRDAAGVVTDTCDAGIVKWSAKQ